MVSETDRLLQHARRQATAGPTRHEPKGTHQIRDDVDLLDGRFYAAEPHDAWRWMREHAPAYHDPNSDVWALTCHHDVMSASRDPATFSNAHNIRPHSTPAPMMISMDDPEHKRRRKLVSKGFTPRRVAAQAPVIGAICDDLLEAVADRDRVDWVNDVAAHLPLIVIADMLGVAPDDRNDLLRWSDTMLRATTSTDTQAIEEGGVAFEEYQTYIHDVIEDRRRQPRDDLISVLVHAEVDGDRLDEESLVWETLLILVGGDETTRHVLSGGLHALLTHPDQWERLRSDPALLPTAVEEMLRWVSPIKTMSRRVTETVEIGGERIPAGDDVVLVYPSANRDHRQFEEPDRFDVAREPNHHVAFGFGTHFCLGNALARVELIEMFSRLVGFPELAPAWGDADPPRRPSSFISGFETLPVVLGPRSEPHPA